MTGDTTPTMRPPACGVVAAHRESRYPSLSLLPRLSSRCPSLSLLTMLSSRCPPPSLLPMLSSRCPSPSFLLL